MSVESDIRAALIGYAPLTALVPEARIALDLVEQDTPRPYIVLSKVRDDEDLGLDGTVFGVDYGFELQIVGTSRANALQVKTQARAALRAADFPPDDGAAGYDGENDLEVETVAISHYEGNTL